MHQRASLLAITVKSLGEAPASVQEYVEEYFKRTNVLGHDCRVAFIGSLRRTYGDYSYRNRGVAPSSWTDELQMFITANPADCFEFYASWDDGCIGPEPD